MALGAFSFNGDIQNALADFSVISKRVAAEIFGVGEREELLSVVNLKEKRVVAESPVSPALERSAPAKVAPINRSVSIAEIVFDPEGSDVGKEFIKLHNYSVSDIDLKGWSLRLLREGKDDSTSLAKIGSVSADKTIIIAGEFFFVGLNKYSGDLPIGVKRSAPLPNDGGFVLLFDSSGVIVESVKYGDEGL